MNVNWIAISAIGSVCGSLATFSAVLVALWQTRLKTERKLLLKFSPTVYGVGDVGVGDVPYISLAVSNIGNRKVKVVSWGYLLDDGGSTYFSSSNMGYIGNNLPIELLPDDTANLFFVKDSLILSLSQNCQNEKQNEKSKLKMYITDDTGKRYVYNTKMKIGLFFKSKSGEICKK